MCASGSRRKELANVSIDSASTPRVMLKVQLVPESPVLLDHNFNTY